LVDENDAVAVPADGFKLQWASNAAAGLRPPAISLASLLICARIRQWW
jgi:hypothetical protein